ncbi:MAG TPA: hypothetical protein VHK88_03000 [Aquihabitans sp.]|jgi:hypothetical protein|nr:hypothetical protein [Aquihabitans sp.]
MAKLSLRDRFYTPRVARALTSPSGILALGAGAAIGVLLAPVGIPAAVVGGVVGGALGYGGRVALAIPRNSRAAAIDPFGVKEPWRHEVKDAVQARDRFEQAVGSFRPGPLKDQMNAVAKQLDDAVAQCWEIARQGQLVADARTRIKDREANWELQRARHAVGEGTPNPTQASTIASLESQLATASRMDALVASTRDQLALLNARLDESVTRAIELSVSNRVGDAQSIGHDVGDIVTDLEALRRAIEDVQQVGGTGPEGRGLTSPGS